MPKGHEVGRYYFHIKEGETLIRDPDGDGLPDECAAYREIRATVDDIVRLPSAYGDLRHWLRREFVAADESGRTVMSLSFAALLGVH